MNEEIKEQTSKEFTIQEWKHWSTKQSEFVRLPESCKSEITKWWLDKLDQALQQHKKRLVEEVEEYFGHVLNDGSGKPMGISKEEIAKDIINLISPLSEE